MENLISKEQSVSKKQNNTILRKSNLKKDNAVPEEQVSKKLVRCANPVPVELVDLSWVASFDIGSKNFCFYIEEFDKNNLYSIKNIPLSERYNLDGTPTTEMNNILNQIFKDGKTIIHKNLDLTDKCDSDKYFDQNVLHNMTSVLDSHESLWDNCEIILVEQQMSFKNKINTAALKIGQHLQSYFLIKYGKFKTIIEYPSFYKTQILGSQKINMGKTKAGKIKYKNIDKPARKKWSIEKAKEILTIRDENDNIILTSKKGLKKDDLADVIIQLASFKYKYFIDKTNSEGTPFA